MKKIVSAVVLTCLISGNMLAQELRKPCITPIINREAMDKDPEAQGRQDALDAYTREFIARSPQSRGAAVDSPMIVIPVVVHIFHEYGPENITDEQVYSAIEVLNRDFQKKNADTAEVLARFKPIIGKANIEFRMAQLDPNGKCTRGVTRTYSKLTRDGRQNAAMTNIINWDTRKYLNIYIVRAIEGAGAFSNFPSAYPVGSKMHGVVCSYVQFGSMGASQGNFAERTIPHEVGHFLNLPHTWGKTNNPGLPENCDDEDDVDDTPNTIGVSNQNCDRNMPSCIGDPSPVANVENTMDYSNCSRMFTIGQALRMRAAMRGAATRNTLYTPENLIATGTNDGYLPVRCIPIADFNAQNSGCTNTPIGFFDASWKDTVTSWKWEFPGGEADSLTARYPTVTYANPGTYSVKLIVSNAAGSDTIEKKDVITIYPVKGVMKAPLTEGFEATNFPTNGWTIESDDARTWLRTTTAAYSGDASFYMKNWNGNPSGESDYLVSPTFDFSKANKVSLRFKAAYARRNNSVTDQLNIYVSKNCGKTYTKQGGKSGETLATTTNQSGNYIPASKEEWKEFVIDLKAAVKAESVLIRIENLSGAGNNLYIDDLEVITDEATGINQVIRTDGVSVYPNPFNGTAKLSFSLLNEENVHLGVYNLLGQEVAVLADTKLAAGDHQFEINEQTAKLSDAGFYLVKLKAGNEIAVQKVLLTK